MTLETSGPMTLDRVPFTHPDAVALREAAVVELGERYGNDEDAKEFIDPATIVVTVVVRFGTAAAACGSIRDMSGADDGVGGVHPAGVGEIKRIFVARNFRRRGLSLRIMQDLERGARDAGLTRLVLETGTEQPEAVALYEKLGYTRIRPYGKYANEPEQLCYGKTL